MFVFSQGVINQLQNNNFVNQKEEKVTSIKHIIFKICDTLDHTNISFSAYAEDTCVVYNYISIDMENTTC